MAGFVGAKITILCRGRVLTLLRDATPAISYPDMWDLPGGGREGNEDAYACIARETREEFGLTLPGRDALYARFYPYPGGTGGWHFGLVWDALRPEDITFGTEGQRWDFMLAAEFTTHPRAVPFLKDRTRSFLDQL